MVSQRKTSRTRPKREQQKQPGSIWDTPHLKQILSEPVGTPMELTDEEARAIIHEHLQDPRPYDREGAERAHKELRKIRRMWGSVATLDA